VPADAKRTAERIQRRAELDRLVGPERVDAVK